MGSAWHGFLVGLRGGFTRSQIPKTQEYAERQKKNGNRCQLLPSEIGYTLQHHFPKRRYNPEFHHKVNGYSVFSKIDNYEPHDLDHHQHEKYLSDYLAEIKIGPLKNLNHEPAHCADHQSEKGEPYADDEDVLSGLQEVPGQAMYLGVSYVQLQSHHISPLGNSFSGYSMQKGCL
jgi:hypothetical protein